MSKPNTIEFMACCSPGNNFSSSVVRNICNWKGLSLRPFLHGLRQAAQICFKIPQSKMFASFSSAVYEAVPGNKKFTMLARSVRHCSYFDAKEWIILGNTPNFLCCWWRSCNRAFSQLQAKERIFTLCSKPPVAERRSFPEAERHIHQRTFHPKVQLTSALVQSQHISHLLGKQLAWYVVGSINAIF